jgi:anti-sigma factor RsiW
VVVDDGRRFLERSLASRGGGRVEPALLARVIKRRLAPGAIVQQWIRGGDPAILSPVTRALLVSFPHLRVFHSIDGWGFHDLASMEPIPVRDSSTRASRLPPDAAADLVGWMPQVRPVDCFERLLV